MDGIRHLISFNQLSNFFIPREVRNSLESEKSLILQSITKIVSQIFVNFIDLRVYLSEDVQTLKNIAGIDAYNLQKLNQPNSFIFKSFYHVDATVKAVKKIYEEPERLKLWDPNIIQSKLIQMLTANNSKIFSKILKPLTGDNIKN